MKIQIIRYDTLSYYILYFYISTRKFKISDDTSIEKSVYVVLQFDFVVNEDIKSERRPNSQRR